MNKVLDKKLVKDFPLLYSDRHADMNRTCMCWGFDCGDGWYPLIRALSMVLEPLIQEYKETYSTEKYPCAMQVKEKYGSLRFYMTHETPEMGRLIALAESKSEKICEECGKPGELCRDGWMITLCQPCLNKRRG